MEFFRFKKMNSQKKEAVSKLSFIMDTELVEVGI